jgi:hypothetical protein
VDPVHHELVSAEFPVYQGKYRENLKISLDTAPMAIDFRRNSELRGPYYGSRNREFAGHLQGIFRLDQGISPLVSRKRPFAAHLVCRRRGANFAPFADERNGDIEWREYGWKIANGSGHFGEAIQQPGS